MRLISCNQNFEAASREVLHFLHERLEVDLWMVTRTEGDHWIVLYADDRGYGVAEGDVLKWVDSRLSPIGVRGSKCTAQRAQVVPAYATVPGGDRPPTGAHIGAPLLRRDGSVFGTLCGIDGQLQPEVIAAELPLIQLLARLLSALLQADLDAADQKRRTERAEAAAMRDSLTGLYNHRGWTQLMAAEDARCRRYGHSACILFIDLDGLKRVNDSAGHPKGDEIIRCAAETVKSAVRKEDAVARLGGDEFAVLGVECDAEGAERLTARVTKALGAAGVSASVGSALRHPAFSLTEAEREADEAMYSSKRARKKTLIAAS